MSGITHILERPVMAHGEEISELNLREPTSKDVIELGYPTLIIAGDDGVTGVEVRTKVIARYVMKLAKVPLSTVENLTLRDNAALTAIVMGFFGQSGGEDDDSAQPAKPH